MVEDVVVVSSSKPSCPYATIARSAPRACKTPSMLRAIFASETPTSCLRIRPGLASGPRKLNMVATPSSFRVGAAWRIAGWKRGARQKPTPASRTQRPTPFGVISMATPRASRTSADPDAELEALPPCLQTMAPAPATTKATVVEMLMLWERSPPVPHVQTALLRSSSVSGTATPNRSIVASAAVNSPIVSPLVRMPIAKPAI